MKPGIYLSRLVDDPVSKKRFMLALVVVIGLHLILLAIWKRAPSVPDVKKKPDLVIELGSPPPSGSTGEGAARSPVIQDSPAQKAKPTPKPPPSKTPASPEKSGKPAENAATPAAPSDSTQAPSAVATQSERQVSVDPSPKTSSAPEVAASPAVSAPAGGAKVPSETVRTAEADYKAAYLNNPRPSYPRLAHRMGIEGTVILLADVSEEGMPLQVRLFQSSGNDLLDQSALNTVTQWRFTPARKDGVITRSTVRIPVTFSLKVQAKK